MMKQHQYKITVEHLANAKGEAVQQTPLVFNAPNHDNLFDIVARVMNSGRFNSQEDAYRFIIGLKMMSEVVLEHRNEPFFSEISPYLADIMKIVKGK